MKALTLTVIFLLTMPVLAEPRPGVPATGVENAEMGGFDDLGAYQPVLIHSFLQVPKPTRVKVMQHLAARIGPEFLHRLKFEGGEIIDHRRLYQVNPNAKNYRWVVPAYRLNFVFADRSKGIGRYYAQISLSSTGEVVDEVNLPDMHKYLSSQPVISLAEASKIALKTGLHPDKISSDIRYLEDKDAVVWRFSEVVADDGVSMKIRYIDVDVYNGKQVNDSYGAAIR